MTQTQTMLRLLSADNHIVEPPDLWTTRIEPKFRDQAPRIERREDADYWVVADRLSVGSVGNATHPGERYTAARSPRDQRRRPLGGRAQGRLRPPTPPSRTWPSRASKAR